MGIKLVLYIIMKKFFCFSLIVISNYSYLMDNCKKQIKSASCWLCNFTILSMFNIMFHQRSENLLSSFILPTKYLLPLQTFFFHLDIVSKSYNALSKFLNFQSWSVRDLKNEFLITLRHDVIKYTWDSPLFFYEGRNTFCLLNTLKNTFNLKKFTCFMFACKDHNQNNAMNSESGVINPAYVEALAKELEKEGKFNNF